MINRDYFRTLSGESRSRLRRAAPPARLQPMLATGATPDVPSIPGGRWIFEQKLDGERVLALRRPERCTLFSRDGQDVSSSYPEVAEALGSQDAGSFIVDGEVVAFSGAANSFAQLQRRLMELDDDEPADNVPVYYHLFDILYLDGFDTTELPLRDRKRLLRHAIAFNGPLRLVEHRTSLGNQFLEEARRRDWEGLVAKRADSPYTQGRSADWLRINCGHRQEFVIGGFTDPKGGRVGFGAVLAGYYDCGSLRYAGRVGAGFNHRTLRRLRDLLQRTELARSPFVNPIMYAEVHWTEPALVAEVSFAEWTREGRLRYPRFVGLRRDKPPHEVVREES